MYAGLTLRDNEEWQQLKAEKDAAELQVYDTQSRIESLLHEVAATQARIEALQWEITNAIRTRDNLRHEIVATSQSQSVNRIAFRNAAVRLHQHEIELFDEYPLGWTIIETVEISATAHKSPDQIAMIEPQPESGEVATLSSG